MSKGFEDWIKDLRTEFDALRAENERLLGIIKNLCLEHAEREKQWMRTCELLYASKPQPIILLPPQVQAVPGGFNEGETNEKDHQFISAQL